MNQLTATVIVPTYNRSALLARTLESLRAQDVAADRMEIVVVDDGSSDDTARTVRTFPGVDYLYQQDEGYRVAAARNAGIRRANGDVCVFVDSGVVLGSGAVRAHLDAHASSVGPAAVIGYVYGFEQDDDDVVALRSEVADHDPDTIMDRFAAGGRWPDMRETFYRRYDDALSELPAPWVAYWTCNASASTAQLREVGMFDETFTTWGAEDIDLAFRLHTGGASFLVDRAARAVHLPHPKKYAEREAGVVANYEYMAGKYQLPVIDLLLEPSLDLLRLNEQIRERGIPVPERVLTTA